MSKQKSFRILVIAVVAVLVAVNTACGRFDMRANSGSPDQLLADSAAAERSPIGSGSAVDKSVNQLGGMGEIYGVIVGVADYLYLDGLDTPDEGARKIYNQLEYLWGERAHLRLLLDREATRQRIEEAVNWLAASEDSDDVVLFYFTGHGNEDVLAPYDSLADSYDYDISAGLFNRWLDSLDSQKVVVVIDSCSAGGYAQKLRYDGPVVLLGSCAADEDATTELSDYIVQGLLFPDGLDVDGDRQISAEELYAYLQSQHIPGQHPCLFDYSIGELELISMGGS